MPEIEEGAKCHEFFMGNKEPCKICPTKCDGTGSCIIENRHLGIWISSRADEIHWNGEDCWLITCRELEA